MNDATISRASLIARPDAISDTAGAGLLDSGTSLAGDLDKDAGPWEIGADSLAVGLDVLSMALNPLGEVVKAGVGWLLEHIDFLREPLEVLTGDPNQIKALSATWANIAKSLTNAADYYNSNLGQTSAWQSDAATAYRTTADDYNKALQGLGGLATKTSDGVKIAGMIVATERAIIFDLIASFISRVITEALLAAAASVVTLGGSLAAFVASVTADAAILGTKISKQLARLLQVVGRFVKKFDSLGKRVTDFAANAVAKASRVRQLSGLKIGNLQRSKDALRRVPGTPSGIQRAGQIAGNLDRSGSTIGKVADFTGVKIVKEGYKAATDEH